MTPSEKINMTTMVGCMNKLHADGYTENFVAKEKGLEAPTNQKVYGPTEVKIANFYRFEGESDPADNAIVYAIETNDGIKGMLVDSYGGPYANRKISQFITEVEDITKKEPHT
ncbi:MAG: hypothetical protein K0S33_644 [Bacteroidetes bacterium]|jgi:hypothetical protein|nr:hypothetical protein [Bacteroidota bacterium]